MLISGQKTVTTAGTAERLSTGKVANTSLVVKALPANIGNMFIGNVSGDVASGNGMALEPGDSIVFAMVKDLRELWVDSAVNGEGVAWIVLEV
jgi:hypothetical protein